LKSVVEYLEHVKALIILHPQIARWETIREEVQGDKGLFRYRLVLRSAGLLEAFSYFTFTRGRRRMFHPMKQLILMRYYPFLMKKVIVEIRRSSKKQDAYFLAGIYPTDTG
jgi:hypothetical protein